jgi:prepilin-type N-terminal cleavage/methylation domain-containing protein/prepilin-type processing-associated H-X9-DG protein
MSQSSTSPKAFTLVELLVVIGIIALLLAILMPSLSAARQSAITLRCMANLRQMGQAFSLYVNENRGALPPANQSSTGSGTGDYTRWFNRIQYMLTQRGEMLNPPYPGDPLWRPHPIFLCPNSLYPQEESNEGGQGANYGMNAMLGKNNPPYNWRMSQLQQPARLILVTERWGRNTSGNRDTNWGVAPPKPYAATGVGSLYPIDMRKPENVNQGEAAGALRLSHVGKANFLYADFHVETLTPQETWRVAGARDVSTNDWYPKYP